MWKSIACDALRSGRRLQLSYDGFTRVVEVHAVGSTRDGNDVMRAFQVRGGSNSRQQIGWKLLRLDEAFAAVVIDEESEAPRAGYQRRDKAMWTIDCEI